jgi:flagellar FliL protein
VRKSKLVIGAAGGLLVLTAAGAGAWWWLHSPLRARFEAKAAEPDTRAYKYVSLDKIIVMLRKPTGDATSHYIALDLVFKTPAESEEAMREQLPLLRSVAVRDLSGVTMEDINHFTIDELTRHINKAFGQSYPTNHAGKPFTEAMIGKLIVE